MTLTHGMDSERARAIGQQLGEQAGQITTVAQSGHESMSRLLQAWHGADTESFAEQWSLAGRQCEEIGDRLRVFGQRMLAQVDEQDGASRADGGPAGGGGSRGGGGVSSGNPDITDDKDGATYEEIDGPLIDDEGIEPDDIRQGGLGDCWLISSLRGIAGSPEGAQLLAENIEDNGDGTYDVTLYDDGEPVVVTVTGEIPVDADGNPVYAGNDGGPTELWPMLFEKAMAQQFGGAYEDLDADWPARAMEALTGHDVETYDEGFLPWDGKDFPDAQSLHDRLEDGGVLVASTNGDGEKASDGDLVSNHAYTVTDVDPDTGRVTVQNPWGSGYPPITMSHAEFEKRFARLDVGTTT